MSTRPCVVCDGAGSALCRACQEDYDEQIVDGADSSMMAVIRWTAARAHAKERESAKQAMDLCLRKYGAAIQIANAFEELRQAEIGKKMDGLMAGLSALIEIERVSASKDR